MADFLITEMILRDRYTATGQKIVGTTNAIAKAQTGAQRALAQTNAAGGGHSWLAGLKEDGEKSLGILKSVATMATAAGTAVAAALAWAVLSPGEKAAEYDALVAALESVEGSADAAAKAIERVRKIAAMPGLGQQEALAGYTGLRRNGFDPFMSESILKEFGNANAQAGGGKAELGRIMMALTQMKNAGWLQGDELNELNDAGIAASTIVKRVFGTTDGGELKKKGIDSTQVIAALTLELAKLPRVVGGAKNAFENLGDAWDFVLIQTGRESNKTLTQLTDKLSEVMTAAEQGGVFKFVGQEFGELIGAVAGDLDHVEGTFLKILAGIKTGADLLELWVVYLQGMAEGFGLEKTFKILTDLLGHNLAGIDVTGIYDQNLARLQQLQAKGNKAVAAGSGQPGMGWGDYVDKLSSYLKDSLQGSDYEIKKVVANTGRTADALERSLSGSIVGNTRYNRADAESIRHGGGRGRNRAEQIGRMILDAMAAESMGTLVSTDRAIAAR